MDPDPIVKEVREAGAKLAAEAGYDVHRFFENLREVEKKCDNPSFGNPLPNHGSVQGRKLPIRGASLSSTIIEERRGRDVSDSSGFGDEGETMTREQILEFLNANPVCHLATCEGKQPRVRGMMMYRADATGPDLPYGQLQGALQTTAGEQAGGSVLQQPGYPGARGRGRRDRGGYGSQEGDRGGPAFPEALGREAWVRTARGLSRDAVPGRRVDHGDELRADAVSEAVAWASCPRSRAILACFHGRDARTHGRDAHATGAAEHQDAESEERRAEGEQDAAGQQHLR